MKYNIRRGLTVIEVLTSIIVALIGVAGVLVMIPFAVGQAEIGFDQETSYRLGANFAGEYELQGYPDSRRWVVAPGIGPGVRTVRNYCVDPIGRLDSQFFPFVEPNFQTAILTAALGVGTGSPTVPTGFPSADKCILTERVNVTNGFDGAPLSRPVAAVKFSWRDDLQVQTPLPAEAVAAGYVDVALAPPRQIDDLSGVTPVRRQALGEMSVVVLAVPNNPVSRSPANVAPYTPADYPQDNPDGIAGPLPAAADSVREFRNYFLVYKNRPILTSGLPPASTPYDRVYEVLPTFTTIANNAQRLAFGGGSMILQDIPAAGPSLQRREIRRGDWIALTNVAFDPVGQRFSQQINFYQVDDASEAAAAPGNWQVTLHGPDFDFCLGTNTYPQNYAGYTPFVPRYDAATTTWLPSRTYAIHLPDVWAVFERTYRN